MSKVSILTLTEPIAANVEGRAKPPLVGVEVRDSSALRRAQDKARDRGSRFVEVPGDRGPVQARDAPLGTLAEPGHGARHSPVSRKVMLTLPGGSARSAGPVPASTLGTPW